MAGSSAIKAMRAEASRQIRGRKNVQVKGLKSALTIDPVRQGKLEWVIRASGGIMPVHAYFPRQTKKGTSVEINKGARKVIAHAFIATMKSGHTGVFMRTGTAFRQPMQHGKGHARYRGQKRQPIKELFTTRVSEAFIDSIPPIAQRGRDVFGQTYQRLMSPRART
jgi:hypothetical protein